MLPKFRIRHLRLRNTRNEKCSMLSFLARHHAPLRNSAPEKRKVDTCKDRSIKRDDCFLSTTDFVKRQIFRIFLSFALESSYFFLFTYHNIISSSKFVLDVSLFRPSSPSLPSLTPHPVESKFPYYERPGHSTAHIYGLESQASFLSSPPAQPRRSLPRIATNHQNVIIRQSQRAIDTTSPPASHPPPLIALDLTTTF